MNLADRVVMVLVEPQQPGNVGAAARAMKNMGLTKLIVVAPPAFDPERARWMAPGADDMLANARYVGTLAEALEGTHFAIATTARHRRQGQIVMEPSEAAAQVLDAPEGAVTAILFGREDFGLTTADILRCQAIVRIPTAEHASLNLGQAVLLLSHALFEAARERGLRATGRVLGGNHGPVSTADVRARDKRDHPADLGALEPIVAELVSVLERVGYTRRAPADKVALTLRQSLVASQLSIRHVEAFRGMVARVSWALDHPEIDARASRSDNDAT